MRILFLSPRQPLPARSGAKLREYHFLRALGGWAEVTYLYFADPDFTNSGSQPLTVEDLPFCREVIGIPKPPAYGMEKTVMGILGRWPLPILNYTSPEMSAAVARQMDARDFDIIHLDSIHMIRYAPASRRVVYNWHNIESEAMRRFSANSPSLARRWYARLTAHKLEALESAILHSDCGHIVCSEREYEQLRRIAPAARIAVVENGVDTGFFAGARDEAATPRHIVFVGAMDYFPNADAAIFFANRIWPNIRNKLGDAELIIVGANPGPAVIALREIPGVQVTGMVPDVSPFYREALAAVAPLRTGGGTRLKILEAMAAGVPVISTPLGAEGLDVTDGENILLADSEDTDGWANHVASLADSPSRRAQLTEAGFRLVKTRYDWEILGAKLRKIYQSWASER
jgi:sugar transferase (PEP-CTERM/EpsH1 system associated)